MTEPYQKLLDRCKVSLPENVKVREVEETEISSRQGFSGSCCTSQFDTDGQLNGFEILLDEKRTPFMKLLFLLHELGHAKYGFAEKSTLELRNRRQTTPEADFLFDVESECAAIINVLEEVLTLVESDLCLLDQAMSQVMQQSRGDSDPVHRDAARRVIGADTWGRCEAQRRSLTVPCQELPPGS